MTVAFVREFTDSVASPLNAGATVAVGNLVLFFLDWDDTTPSIEALPTDSAGNIYTQIGLPQFSVLTGVTFRGALFAAINKAALNLAITPHWSSGPGTSPEFYGNEWSGTDLITPVPVVAQGAGLASTPSLSLTTLTDANQIMTFCCPTNGTPGVVASYTSISTFNGNDVSRRNALKSPAGLETANYNQARDWGMFLVAIQPPQVSGLATPQGGMGGIFRTRHRTY